MKALTSVCTPPFDKYGQIHQQITKHSWYKSSKINRQSYTAIVQLKTDHMLYPLSFK